MILNCINRNIVECKASYAGAITSELQVLIETSWNVKVHLPVWGALRALVLIETSWNVKSSNFTNLNIPKDVLIETSWNVKRYRNVFQRFRPSINRNIVECKEYHKAGQ